MRLGRYSQAMLPVRRRRRGAGGPTRRTITPSLLVSYESNVDQNAYTTTGSFTPTAGALGLLWIVQSGTNPTGPTSFSGPFASSWTLFGTAFSVSTLWFGMFRAMAAAPGTGQLTVNFNAGEATTGINLIATQYVGVNQSGTNGSGAVLQPTRNSGTAITTIPIALASILSHPNNYCAYGLQHNANEDATPAAGGGFTRRGSPCFHNGPNMSLMVADKQNDNTDDPTWVTSAAARWHAVEVVAG